MVICPAPTDSFGAAAMAAATLLALLVTAGHDSVRMA